MTSNTVKEVAHSTSHDDKSQKDAIPTTTILMDDLESPMELESLCMNCRKNGCTKLLSTRIPFYKQVILMSFFCEHCGFRNNEIQSSEPAQEFGTEIVLQVKNIEDLNRAVVKSEYASIEVPELELVIPAKSQPGEVTNIEGILSRVASGLQQNQESRTKSDPKTAEKIEKFIERVKDCMELKQAWTLKLKDASGNCFIQNPNPLHVDPQCITSHYYRSIDEDKLLGFLDDDAVEPDADTLADREWKSYEDCKNEIMRFNGPCQNCGVPVDTMMKPTNIPYFQTVIIISTSCDNCGSKSNDVKSGGATQEQGCRLTVTIEEDFDLARDVLKSDTCELLIPDLEIEVGPGALSGRFTTVEGILDAIKDQLLQQTAFFFGDSATSVERQKITRLLEEIDAIRTLKRKGAKLVLNDPAGNSYIMSLNAPLDDSRLVKEFYKRSYEQDDELGLNDMKTENYQQLDSINEEESADSEKNNEEKK